MSIDYSICLGSMSQIDFADFCDSQIDWLCSDPKFQPNQSAIARFETEQFALTICSLDFEDAAYDEERIGFRPTSEGLIRQTKNGAPLAADLAIVALLNELLINTTDDVAFSHDSLILLLRQGSNTLLYGGEDSFWRWDRRVLEGVNFPFLVGTK